MHKESYQYQCQITGKVKAYKEMSAQVARALNWTLAQQGSYGRWVMRVIESEIRDVVGRARQNTEPKLLLPRSAVDVNHAS